MKIEEIISLRTLVHSRLQIVLGLLSSAVMIPALALAFVIAPAEREMGPVQRIFYFHVASAFASYGMIGLLLVGSAFYLVTRIEEWDVLAQASAGVGLLFCSIVLASGMIWGHSAWNTWWSWEPRLVASLVLWLLLISYVLLRWFSSGSLAEARFAAVLGLVAAIFVPVVIFSVRYLAPADQLHPQVVGRQGLRDPAYVWALISAIGALFSVSIWLLVMRMGSLLIGRRILALQRQIRAPGFAEAGFVENRVAENRSAGSRVAETGVADKI